MCMCVFILYVRESWLVANVSNQGVWRHINYVSDARSCKNMIFGAHPRTHILKILPVMENVTFIQTKNLYI